MCNYIGTKKNTNLTQNRQSAPTKNKARDPPALEAHALTTAVYSQVMPDIATTIQSYVHNKEYRLLNISTNELLR